MPRVSEVMVTDVVTIDPPASIADAAKQMIQEEKGPLPIMEGDQLHGMITDRDIVAYVVAEGRDNNSTTVHDIATHELITVSPDQDVEEAQQLMDQHGLTVFWWWKKAGSSASSQGRTSAPTKDWCPDHSLDKPGRGLATRGAPAFQV